jgi:hypothetical protein
MLSHTHLGVNDFDRAFDFYSKIMGALGCPLKFFEPERPRAGWKPPDADRPLLVMENPRMASPPCPATGR